jgi:inner membrane protein
VDNLCHTLVGAACGEAGLKRRSALGNLTLMIAANLPDLDALVFATSIPSVAIRRGWTHGILAQVLLPVALAAVMAAVGRRRGARFGPLLLLCYVGVLSHVALDLLNNYGVRLLMPFSNRWFYGDAVFIIDVWLWLLLGLGIWRSVKRRNPRPARVAIVIATAYIVAMVVSARVARGMVADAWRTTHGVEPASFMVGPQFLTPVQRQIIVDAGDHYTTGRFRFPRSVEFDSRTIPKRDGDPAVQEAMAGDRRIQAVLTWARFPYFVVETLESGTRVTVRDVRFGNNVGSVTATVGNDR